MAKYIIDVPDEVPVSDELVPFDMCRPSWYLEAYEKGKAVAENEVWEFAKKVRLKEFFDDNHNLHPYLDYFDSYQDAKAKHEELKERKNKIRVGDEVEYSCPKGTCRFVVFGICGDKAYGFKYPSNFYDFDEYYDIAFLTKTGRHFSEVEKLIGKMSCRSISF